MLLFELAAKGQETGKADANARFMNLMRDFNGLTKGMVSAEALEWKMGELRSHVAGSKPIAQMMAGNKELASQWEQMNQAFDAMKKARMPGMAYYTFGDYGFSQLNEISSSAMNNLDGSWKMETVVPKDAFVASSAPPKAVQVGAGGKIIGFYAGVMDKLDAMQDAIENNRPDLAAQFGADIIRSAAYKDLLRSSPAFREHFENMMHGLKLLNPSSPEAQAELKKLQNEFISLNHEKIENHLATVPEQLNSAQRNTIMADAYGSLQEIKSNMIKAGYLEGINVALKENDLEKANNLLDGLALITDMRYGILRYAPEKGGQREKQQPMVQEFVAARDNTSVSSREMAGPAYLPDTKEGRFAAGSALDAINQLVLSGKIEQAKVLIARTEDRMLYRKDLAQQSPTLRAPDLKSYSDRLQLSQMFGIKYGEAGSVLPLYATGAEAYDAWKDYKAGDYSSCIFHAAAAAGYLVLDVMAIYTGGMSKGAVALFREARAVERIAAMGKNAKGLAGSLDELAVALREANAAGAVTAEQAAKLEKRIDAIKEMATGLSKKGERIADLGRSARWKGGAKEFEVSHTIPSLANEPAKIQVKLDPVLDNAKQAVKDIGAAPKPVEFKSQIKTIENARDDYLKLEIGFGKTAKALDKTMNQAWTLRGQTDLFVQRSKSEYQKYIEKPFMSSSEKASTYEKYVKELDAGVQKSINGLKDGEHFKLTLNGEKISMKGEFTFVKQGEKTLIYRSANYDKLLKGMETPTTLAGQATKDAGKLWSKKLDGLVPVCKEGEHTYAVLEKAAEDADPIKFNKWKDDVASKEPYEITVGKKKEVYTFVRQENEIVIFEQGAYKNALKQIEKLGIRTWDNVVEKGGKVVGAAKAADEWMATIPKKTLEYTIYKPQEWRGIRPSWRRESWGEVPIAINDAASWTRKSNAFSMQGIKKNFGFRKSTSTPLMDMKDAATLHGWRGWMASVPTAYPVGWGIGTLSGIGRMATYPIQVTAWGVSGAAGTAALAVEGAVGLTAKGIKMAATTWANQRIKYIVPKYIAISLEHSVASPEALGVSWQIRGSQGKKEEAAYIPNVQRSGNALMVRIITNEKTGEVYNGDKVTIYRTQAGKGEENLGPATHNGKDDPIVLDPPNNATVSYRVTDANGKEIARFKGK